MPRVVKPIQDRSVEDQVNEFLQVLAGHPVDSNNLTDLEKQVIRLNGICADIFRVSGSVAKATGAFIFGEPDQNKLPRGESPHLE